MYQFGSFKRIDDTCGCWATSSLFMFYYFLLFLFTSFLSCVWCCNFFTKLLSLMVTCLKNLEWKKKRIITSCGDGCHYSTIHQNHFPFSHLRLIFWTHYPICWHLSYRHIILIQNISWQNTHPQSNISNFDFREHKM